MKKLLIASIIVMASVGFTGCLGVSDGMKMAEDVQKKTLTADNAIYNYEWFEYQEGSINALQKKIDRYQSDISGLMAQMPQDRDQWSQEDRDELRWLKDAQRDIMNHQDDVMEEYNAKSRMVHKSVFKGNLPTNIIRGAGTGLKFTFAGQ